MQTIETLPMRVSPTVANYVVWACARGNTKEESDASVGGSTPTSGELSSRGGHSIVGGEGTHGYEKNTL